MSDRVNPKPKKTTERFALRLVNALVNGRSIKAFVADDDFTAERLKRKGLRAGDMVGAELKKPRDPRNWKRIHKLGQLLIENVEDFQFFTDAHKVIKRIQIETGIGCEEMAIKMDGLGMVMVRLPQSLAFDRMDEAEFTEIHGQFCQHVIDKYWKGLEQHQVEEMAGLVGLAA